MDQDIKPIGHPSDKLVEKCAMGNNVYRVYQSSQDGRFRTELWMGGELTGVSHHDTRTDAVQQGERMLEAAAISEIGGLTE